MIGNTLTFGQFADELRKGRYTPTLQVTAGPTPPSSQGVTFPPLLGRVLKQIMVSDVQSRFMTATDPQGRPWQPLSHPRPNGGDKPLNDTGILRASIHGDFDSQSVWVATTHPGAALQNFGGTVRRKDKMLAIPLTREAKRAGSPRRWKAGQLEFQPTRKRRTFLLMSVDRLGNRVGQFLLVDSVTVPQREFMGLSDKGWSQCLDAVAEFEARGWIGA